MRYGLGGMTIIFPILAMLMYLLFVVTAIVLLIWLIRHWD